MKLNTRLALLAGLVLFTNACGLKKREVDVQEVAVSPIFKVGDVYRFELEKYKKMPAKPGNKSNSKVFVEVFQQMENGDYILDWKYRDIKAPHEDALTKELSSIVEKLIIRTRVGEEGDFKEITNYDQLREKMEQVVHIMRRELKKNPMTAAQADMAVEYVRSMLTKENMEGIMFKEIQLFHNVYGVSLNKAEPVAAEIPYPHPMTGDIMNMDLNMRLSKVFSDSSCQIVLIQKLDPESFKKVMKSMTGQMAEIAEGNINVEEANAAYDAMSFDMYDSTFVDVNYRTGAYKQIFNKRTVKVNGEGERIDQLIMKRI